MIRALTNWWHRIKPTDGPGHTDYPRNDIRTHRSIARDLYVLGWAGAGVALVGALFASWILVVSGGVWWLMCRYAATDVEKEALEWELALERGEE